MRGLVIVSLFAAVAACTSYSPNLPPDPFVCGDSDPKCPDGFACVQSGSQMLCMSTGGGGHGDGGGTFMCADDSQLEGTTRNDTTATAFVTGLAPTGGRMNITFDGAAICPATDVDDYAITLDTTQNIEVIIEYDSDGAALQGSILTSGGTVIVNATAQGTDTIRAYLPNGAAQTYYASVFGPGTGENNYKITINVTNPGS